MVCARAPGCDNHLLRDARRLQNFRPLLQRFDENLDCPFRGEIREVGMMKILARVCEGGSGGYCARKRAGFCEQVASREARVKLFDRRHEDSPRISIHLSG